MNKFGFSKKGEMAMALIITTVILLIVLAVYFNFIKDAAGTYEKGTGCQALGGVLAKDCPDEHSKINMLFDAPDKSGNYCCISKSGVTKDDFEDWAKSLQNSLTSQNNTNNLDNYDYSNDNYYVPSDQIPDYGSGETTIISGNLVSGKTYFKINDVPIASGKVAKVYPDKISISAVNSNSGTSSCELYVMKRVNGESILPPIKSYPLNPCKKGSELRMTLFDLAILDEPYKVDFVAKDSQGKTLMSDSVYFKTSDFGSEGSSQNGLMKRSIIHKTEQLTRNNKRLTFIYPELKGPSQMQDLRTSYSIVPLSVNCAIVDSTVQSYNSLQKIMVPKNNKLCVVFDILKSPLAEAANDIVEITNTDEVHIIDKETFNLYFNSCSKQCDDFSSPRSSCKNFNEMDTECMYDLDCVWSKRDGSRSCETCAGINSCSDFDLQDGCTSNNCIPTKCEWEEGVIAHGKCVEAS